jgi:hypothetical protein
MSVVRVTQTKGAVQVRGAHRVFVDISIVGFAVIGFYFPALLLKQRAFAASSVGHDDVVDAYARVAAFAPAYEQKRLDTSARAFWSPS